MFVRDDDPQRLFCLCGSVDAHVGYEVAGFVDGFEAFEGDVFSVLEFDEVLDANKKRVC